MKRDLEFLFEMGAIRLISRQWSRFHFPNVQNLAEHHFRVTWLALMLAAQEGGDIDTAKLMKMALVHDIAESRTGDVDYLARQYVDRHEDIGIQDILADTSLEKEFLQLWQEYEDRTSIEAKIVKDADNLDVDMELREQGINGSSLEQAFDANRQQVRRTKYYTKSAEKLYDQIKVANPHDWHTKSPRNRLNGGDWKPEETKK